MANVGKRIWNLNISCNDAITIAIDFLIRLRAQNVLTEKKVKLYKAYIVEGHHDLGVAHGITQYFKFSKTDNHEMDTIRDEAARLLTTVIKAHFFNYENALVIHEPYLFAIPDVSSSRKNIYGIIYKLDNNLSIVVGSEDLAKVSSAQIFLGEFPVCLQKNSFKWFDRSHWKKMKAEESPFFKIGTQAKPEDYDKIDKVTLPKDFIYGTLLDLPFELKDTMKPTGIRWAKGLKKWYIPTGMDPLGILEYLDFQKEELKYKIANQQSAKK